MAYQPCEVSIGFLTLDFYVRFQTLRVVSQVTRSGYPQGHYLCLNQSSITKLYTFDLTSREIGILVDDIFCLYQGSNLESCF